MIYINNYILYNLIKNLVNKNYYDKIFQNNTN